MARKILLADDSVTAQNMGRKILADAGYEVIAVNNGSAALKKISEVRPDLVVLDVYMPGYSGLEVCQRLKESPETQRVPVLLTVGKLEPFKPEEAQRVRAEGFIVKPFEASELLAALSKLEDKIVPRAAESSKTGRFARAIAAAEASDRERSEAAAEQNGWKSRIGFPRAKTDPAKTEPEERPTDDAALYNPVNRDLRTVVETPAERAASQFDEKRPVAPSPEPPRVDVAALATEGLPKDVTAEEVAAIAAAAAQIQMAEAAIADGSIKADGTVKKDEPQPQTTTEPLHDEPVTMAVAAESSSVADAPRWTAVPVALEGEEAVVSLEQEMQKAYAAAFAATDAHSGLEAPAGEAQVPPAQISCELVSSEAVSPVPVSSAPVFSAPAVEEAAAISLIPAAEVEPQPPMHATTIEPVAATPEPEAKPKPEPVSAISSGATEAEIAAQTEPPAVPAMDAAFSVAPSDRATPEAATADFVVQPAAEEGYAALESSAVVEAVIASSDHLEAAAPMAASAEIAPPEATPIPIETTPVDIPPAELPPSAEQVEVHQPQAAGLTSSATQNEAQKEAQEIAAPVEQSVPEFPCAPQGESAIVETAPTIEAAAAAATMSNAFAPVVSDAQPATEVEVQSEVQEGSAETRLDAEAVKSTAAAWASWRQIRDTAQERQQAAAPAKAFETPEPAPAESARAAAAGAEQIVSEASPAPTNGDTRDVASIVDSVLADLRPKLMEEISRKMAKK